MLPGGNGMGMMCGMNRSMPISRPGFQGMTSSPMLNSGSMLSSSMTGIPSPANMHSGAGSGQGNSMIRPREAMHMMRVNYFYFKIFQPKVSLLVMIQNIKLKVLITSYLIFMDKFGDKYNETRQLCRFFEDKYIPDIIISMLQLQAKTIPYQ